MTRKPFALLLALAACSTPAAYRDVTRPIYSSAVVDMARLSGAWHEVAGFYDPAKQTCALGVTDIGVTSGGLTIRRSGCGGSGGVVAASVTAPGRLRPAGASEDWWVLWVDADYRTLVLGSPTGATGAILDRSPGGSSDRLNAARDILQWNGYDVAALRAPAGH